MGKQRVTSKLEEKSRLHNKIFSDNTIFNRVIII